MAEKKRKTLTYRKMRCDIPGLESLPPLPHVETQINVDKDRWKNSKMWNIGVSQRRHYEEKMKMKQNAIGLEKQAMKKQTNYVFRGIKRKPEFYQERLEKMVKEAPVNPLPDNILKGILSRIPKALVTSKIANQVLQNLISEIKANYEQVMHQIRGEFTLQNVPNTKLKVFSFSPVAEMDSEWVKCKKIAKALLKKQLYVLHPLMRKARKICGNHLENYLVKEDCFRLEGSFTFEEFHDSIMNTCQEEEEKLMKVWWSELTLLFSNEKNLQEFKGNNRDAFLNCVNTLLVLQVSFTLYRVITNLVENFHLNGNKEADKLPLINLSLQIRGTGIYCAPSFQNINDNLINTMKEINDSFHDVQTMQGWLEGDEDSDTRLNVSVPQHLMDNIIATLNVYLKTHCCELNDLMNLYSQQFDMVVTNKAFAKVQRFLRQKYEFGELCELLRSFEEMKSEVNEINEFKGLSMFHVDLKRLKRELNSIINCFISELTNVAFEKLRLSYSSICQKYEDAKKLLLTVPNDAKEMVDLSDYLQLFKEKLFTELLNEVKVCVNNTISLIHVASLEKEDCLQNAVVAQWPQNTLPVLQKCKEGTSRTVCFGFRQEWCRWKALLMRNTKFNRTTH